MEGYEFEWDTLSQMAGEQKSTPKSCPEGPSLKFTPKLVYTVTIYIYIYIRGPGQRFAAGS